MARGSSNKASGQSLMFGTRSSRKLANSALSEGDLAFYEDQLQAGEFENFVGLLHKTNLTELRELAVKFQFQRLQEFLGETSEAFQKDFTKNLEPLITESVQQGDQAHTVAMLSNMDLFHTFPTNHSDSLALAVKLLDNASISTESIGTAIKTLQDNQHKAGTTEHRMLLLKLRRLFDEINTDPQRFEKVRWGENRDRKWHQYERINNLLAQTNLYENLGFTMASFHQTKIDFLADDADDAEEIDANATFIKARRQMLDGLYQEYDDVLIKQLTQRTPKEIAEALPQEWHENFADFENISKAEFDSVIAKAVKTFLNQAGMRALDELFASYLYAAWRH